ncbi:MAG: mycobacterial-type methylenetetrahydrofolate reductase [Halofilum sp. (in: g-proteobacteria)]|nr:mycobacterial-type methylenetetrahydrofolate reductase [Halofilum sp. (in: g-proteobacteria)]
MATISLAAAPPPTHLGTPCGLNQAVSLRQRLEGTALAEAIDSLFVPMIIDEDSFRPDDFVAHEDPLDFHTVLAQELPGLETIVAQVTPFTTVSDLERRVRRARQQGIGRMVFVGVPREYEESEVIGLYPDQALSYFRDLMPGRGVITIPLRPHEHDRLAAKVASGANFAVTQMLYGPAVIELLGSLLETVETLPEIILSFGYVPAIEADHALIQWLIQDPRAQEEMEWVKATARCSSEERHRRLVEVFRQIVEGVHDLGIRPGLNFEAPYGLSQGAIDTFESMLEIYDPRMVTA